MPLKEANNQRPPRNPGWSCFSRCFSVASPMDEAGVEPASNVRPKGKAMPADTTRQQEKLHKHGKIRSRSKPKQQHDAELMNSSTKSQSPAMISPKYNTQRRQVSAMISITTGTATTHSAAAAAAAAVLSEPKTPMPAARDGHLEPAVGLSVLVVTLAAMLLCGRVCAVFCLCACLYLVPLAREGRELLKRKNSIDLDMDSEEYKKKVILQGFLQRNRRRLT